MERSKALIVLIITGLIAGGYWQVFFGMPLIGHFWFLLIYTAFVFSVESKSVKLWFIGVAVFTHVVEVVGVATGFVFGSYRYGTVLGFQIGAVPIVIGLQWALIAMGLAHVCFPLSKNKFTRAFFVSILAVCFDFVLEIAAIKLGFWSWSAVRVPILNYIAWFVIAFISTLFIPKRPSFVSWYAVLALFSLIVTFMVVL